MRTLILTFAGGLALAASAPAAPLALKPASTELGTAPRIELVDHGCGVGLASRPLAGPLGLLALALLSLWTCSALARHEARTSLFRLARSERWLG